MEAVHFLIRVLSKPIWIGALLCFGLFSAMSGSGAERVDAVGDVLQDAIAKHLNSFVIGTNQYRELPGTIDINPFLTQSEKSDSLFRYTGKLQMLKLYEIPEGAAIREVLVTPFLDGKSGLFFTSSLRHTNNSGSLYFQEKHFFSSGQLGQMHVFSNGLVSETKDTRCLITVGLVKKQGVIIWHSPNLVTQGCSNCFRYFQLEGGRGKQGAQLLRPVLSKTNQ